MNKNLFYIYCLIILESRISQAIACQLFNIDKENFKDKNILKNLDIELLKALKFCECENNLGLINPNKSIFIARLLYDKFRRILKSENKKEELNEFIRDLEGHEKIRKLYEKSTLRWTEEDKETFFKYKLKYALDNRRFLDYETNRRTIGVWIRKYPEGEFKDRLIALNDFSNATYLKCRKEKPYER